MSELEKWRAAKLVTDHYGQRAWIQAIERIIEHEAKSDYEGVEDWRRIASAIAEMEDLAFTHRPN